MWGGGSEGGGGTVSPHMTSLPTLAPPHRPPEWCCCVTTTHYPHLNRSTLLFLPLASLIDTPAPPLHQTDPQEGAAVLRRLAARAEGADLVPQQGVNKCERVGIVGTSKVMGKCGRYRVAGGVWMLLNGWLQPQFCRLCSQYDELPCTSARCILVVYLELYN